MPLRFRSSRTPTGKPELIAIGECGWQDFPSRAQAVVEHFGMTVTQKVDGLDQLLWIARRGDSQFCISWDIWFPEVSVMAWKDTSDAEVERLLTEA